MDLERLKDVIPFKFRVQSYSKTSATATAVAYIDARDAMDLLDKVVGVGNWKKSYYEVKGNMFCSVGIKINGEWVEMSDCGTESNTEKEKGEASDAFKRACVSWGIGRFLYHIPIQKVKTDTIKSGNNYPKILDDNNKQVWDLSKYLFDKLKREGKLPQNIAKTIPATTEKTEVEPEKQEIVTSEKVTNIDKKVTTKDKIIALLDELIKNKDTFEARVKDLVTSYITTKDIDLNSYDWFKSHYEYLCVENKLGMMDQDSFNKAIGG